MGAMSDISEMRKAQAKVDQLQNELIHVARVNAMGTMASVMAHELNQPLSATGAYLAGTERLLLAEVPDISLVLKGLREGRKSAVRAGEILRRMRQMTRKTETTREHVNIRQMVREAKALVLVGRLHQAKFLEIDVPDELTVYADAIQIQQVLMNLMRNAFDANEETGGTYVRISAKPVSDNQNEIAIDDAGPGIPPELEGSLFDFFVSSKPEGLGICLPISRAIVDAHGGRLTATNLPDGGGRFCIIPTKHAAEGSLGLCFKQNHLLPLLFRAI